MVMERTILKNQKHFKVFKCINMEKKMLSQTEYKKLYQPKNEPVIDNIPQFKFVTIEGTGNPNHPDFALATEALYTLSYAIKMSYKKPNPPQGYYPYKVFPLEGVWDLVDKSKPSTDKDNYAYKLMIQQPDFVDQQVFDLFLNQILQKKDNPKLKLLKFEEIKEGMCCQMLHIGSFDDEKVSFDRMESFSLSLNYKRLSKLHKEIYLSDPRKVEQSKLKTILRFQVIKIDV